MIDGLIGAYLRGRYRPDANLREDLQYNIEQLKISIYGLDDWDGGEAVRAILEPYLQTVRNKQAA